jgi:hypothetical protein
MKNGAYKQYDTFLVCTYLVFIVSWAVITPYKFRTAAKLIESKRKLAIKCDTIFLIWGENWRNSLENDGWVRK